MNINYNQTNFLMSVAELGQLPADSGYEVAFAGRSNAGKSSALNSLTGRLGLARTSKTPGRTQLINLFQIDSQRRVVDLPGYGYAKVPLATRLRWQKTLGEYLQTRVCLRALVLVMDIRHPLKEMDQNMLDWAVGCQLPLHILLTKADKLKRGPALQTLQRVKKELLDYKGLVTVQLFSSATQLGLEELRDRLDEFYED